jgi:hypothetical protein
VTRTPRENRLNRSIAEAATAPSSPRAAAGRNSPVHRGSSLKDIVRQQWNFSPPESVLEVEEYRVELHHVDVLELVIKPKFGGGVARASLKSLRLS